MKRRLPIAILATAVLGLGAVAGASALVAGHSPTPSCGWAPPKLLHRLLGVSVRSPRASWAVSAAPVLACGYFERHASLESPGRPLVAIGYFESQYLRPLRGSVPVAGLGHCVPGAACPGPGKPAWLLATRTAAGNARFGSGYVNLVVLRVQDGLNALEIIVDNARGPLSVPSEVARAERLARRLLPRFAWR